MTAWTRTASPDVSTPPQRAERIPPLVNGDHLTSAEFERRYRNMSGVRAELIEGVVYMSSPVNWKKHGHPVLVAGGWLSYYVSKTPGLNIAGIDSTVRLDNDNQPQPNVLLCLPHHLVSTIRETEDGYLECAPDLAIEVANSSASIDLHHKLAAYRRNGVREYLVWRVTDSELDWFGLRDGAFVRQSPDATGLIKSELFPGLWLNPVKLVALDLPGLFADLDAGTATPEHAAFVKKLAPAAESA